MVVTTFSTTRIWSTKCRVH